MSVAIDSVTINSIEDRRLILGKSQAAQVLDIGTDWTTLWIGLRLALDDTGANLISTPGFYLGLISNPATPFTNGPLSAVTSHFVGVKTRVATWTRLANYYELAGNTVWQLWKRVGAVTTGGTPFSGAGGTQGVRMSHQTSAKRCLVILEVTKGSPNFIFNIIYPRRDGILTDVFDCSMALFQEAFDLVSISNTTLLVQHLNASIPGENYAAYGTATFAVNEGTDGDLNGICFAWDRDNSLFRHSDFYWTKKA